MSDRVSDLADLTLAAAADGIRQRKFSSWEITQACLARIGAWQKHTNAFLAVDQGGALKAAARADALTVRGAASGVLHGVPLAHKDIFARANTLVSIGSKIPDRPAIETATVLSRLDAAGAIELGALNLVEFAAGATGHNAYFGDCRNPWNNERIPGGSSSGSAAAVAARMAMGALGTDTAGSIRVPAHFCGVVGLRPTYGRVSRHGVFPRAWSLDTVGPLARTAEDAALLLQAIAGEDPFDSAAEAVAVPNFRAELNRPLAGMRLGVPKNGYYSEIDPGIAALLEASRAVLAKLGAVLVEVETPDPAPLTALAVAIGRAEGAAIHGAWLASRPGDYSPGIREAMEVGLFVPAPRYIDALRQRGLLLKRWLDEVFDKVEVLHTPAFGLPTPTLAECAADASSPKASDAYGRFTWPFAFLGLPAIVAPVGFQQDGMPAGMQLVGRPFAESLLLNAAHLYQRETGWHQKAPVLPK
jgi:aspartyl-tRNA(Asn)/glutamyl-tRNA(Gln) amidotransferase subunit A